VCSRPDEKHPDEAVVFVSQAYEYSEDCGSYKDQSQEEMISSTTEDLASYVLRQVSVDLVPDDRRIAAYLLTNLDEDGLLTVTLIDVARYFHVPTKRIQDVQAILQRADPVGVASVSTQEALLVQLNLLGETCKVPELARIIINNSIELFMHRKVAEIARLFEVSQSQVENAMHFIVENLNPYPARSHWGEAQGRGSAVISSGGMVYQRADIVIYHLNDDPKNPLAVEILMPIRGTLQVNPLFRAALRQAAEERRVEWKADLERASLLVKCLQQRNHTMVRLMQRAVAIQKNYILHGEKEHEPCTRFRVAQELGVHESTISRAVANKAIQLPNGRIVPLSSFFDRSLNARTVIKDMIAHEGRPLSDTELALKLADKGIVVARRTVAKYRAMEGILPAHLRQNCSNPQQITESN
jgi:RNA polymerase sigma-54 factor